MVLRLRPAIDEATLDRAVRRVLPVGPLDDETRAWLGALVRLGRGIPGGHFFANLVIEEYRELINAA